MLSDWFTLRFDVGYFSTEDKNKTIDRPSSFNSTFYDSLHFSYPLHEKSVYQQATVQIETELPFDIDFVDPDGNVLPPNKEPNFAPKPPKPPMPPSFALTTADHEPLPTHRYLTCTNYDFSYDRSKNLCARPRTLTRAPHGNAGTGSRVRPCVLLRRPKRNIKTAMNHGAPTRDHPLPTHRS